MLEKFLIGLATALIEKLVTAVSAALAQWYADWSRHNAMKAGEDLAKKEREDAEKGTPEDLLRSNKEGQEYWHGKTNS